MSVKPVWQNIPGFSRIRIRHSVCLGTFALFLAQSAVLCIPADARTDRTQSVRALQNDVLATDQQQAKQYDGKCVHADHLSATLTTECNDIRLVSEITQTDFDFCTFSSLLIYTQNMSSDL
jgi:hypothetical protein